MHDVTYLCRPDRGCNFVLGSLPSDARCFISRAQNKNDQLPLGPEVPKHKNPKDLDRSGKQCRNVVAAPDHAASYGP
jgi:hypothetical protein